MGVGWQCARNEDEHRENSSFVSAMRDGSAEAETELIARNRRLVLYLVRRVLGERNQLEIIESGRRTLGSCGATYTDLVQAGMIALWEAVRQWEPARGTLATYASVLIRRAIVRAIGQSPVVRVPGGEAAPAVHQSLGELTEDPADERGPSHRVLGIEYLRLPHGLEPDRLARRAWEISAWMRISAASRARAHNQRSRARHAFVDHSWWDPAQYYRRPCRVIFRRAPGNTSIEGREMGRVPASSMTARTR